MSEVKIQELKDQAKLIKLELRIKHQQALDEAARRQGFNDYHHARKELLKKPHAVIFGIDIKYFLDFTKEELDEFGVSEHPSYWDTCRSEYEKYYLANPFPEEDLVHPEDWSEENDWIALNFEKSDIRSIKDAIDFIRSIFFHPPLFIVFDDMLIDLAEYASNDYVRFSG